LILHGFQLL